MIDSAFQFTGTALLILTSLEVDASGASYYGEQSLHYMDVTGESSLVPFGKKCFYCTRKHEVNSFLQTIRVLSILFLF